MPEEDPVRFGILQRYVMGEVFRAFALALLTITCVFVLLTVMTKASQVGLGPAEILKLVPYMIPPSLPYTVPVSLLFASTVVYGRLASDNEVVAVKTAGLSALVLIWPTIVMGLVLSLALSYLTATAIPRASHLGRKVIFANIEDLFYKKLKMERVFDVPEWPFLIKVKDVEGRVMIGAIFKKRSAKPDPSYSLLKPDAAGEPDSFDMVVQAKKARMNFDFDAGLLRVYFEDADIAQSGDLANRGTLKDTPVEFPIPGKGNIDGGKMTEEMTVAEMKEKEADNRDKIAMERKQQAVAAAWFVGSGRLGLIRWDKIHSAYKDFDFWNGEIDKYETEIQMRLSMAWGSLFFVVLGAPVGILFARRDFLSAFISCFMPIILLYYPLMLLGVNLGKEGIMPPYLVWCSNGVLGLIAGALAWPPVLKH